MLRTVLGKYLFVMLFAAGMTSVTVLGLGLHSAFMPAPEATQDLSGFTPSLGSEPALPGSFQAPAEKSAKPGPARVVKDQAQPAGKVETRKAGSSTAFSAAPAPSSQILEFSEFATPVSAQGAVAASSGTSAGNAKETTVATVSDAKQTADQDLSQAGKLSRSSVTDSRALFVTSNGFPPAATTAKAGETVVEVPAIAEETAPEATNDALTLKFEDEQDIAGFAEEPAAEPQVAASETPVIETPAIETEPQAEPAIVEEPTLVEEPVLAEELAAEQPVIEEPIAQEPAIEQPVIEEPYVEPQLAEEPVAEPTIAEEPVFADEPVIAELEAYDPEPWFEDPAFEEDLLELPEYLLEEEPAVAEIPATEPLETAEPSQAELIQEQVPATEAALEQPVLPEPPAPQEPSRLVVVTETSSGEAEIGAEGGAVLVSGGDYGIDIPEGAVSRPTNFTVTRIAGPLPSYLPPLPANFVSYGQAVEIGPSGTWFSVPAAIKLNMGQSEGVPYPGGQSVVLVSDGLSGWEALYTVADPNDPNLLTGYTPHLSTVISGILFPDAEPSLTLHDERFTKHIFATDFPNGTTKADRPGALAADSDGDLYVGNGESSDDARPIVRIDVDSNAVAGSDAVLDPDGVVVDTSSPGQDVYAAGRDKIIGPMTSFTGSGDPVFLDLTTVIDPRTGSAFLAHEDTNINDLAIDMALGKLYFSTSDDDPNGKGSVFQVDMTTKAVSLMFTPSGGDSDETSVEVDPDTSDIWVITRNKAKLTKITVDGSGNNPVASTIKDWSSQFLRVNRLLWWTDPINSSKYLYMSTYTHVFVDGASGGITRWEESTDTLEAFATGMGAATVDGNLNPDDMVVVENDAGETCLYVSCPPGAQIVKFCLCPMRAAGVPNQFEVQEDGWTMTKFSSGHYLPTGLAVDEDNNVYVGSGLGLWNTGAITKITQSGDQSVSGAFKDPDTVMFDSNGDVYGAGQNRIWKLDFAGSGSATQWINLGGSAQANNINDFEIDRNDDTGYVALDNGKVIKVDIASQTVIGEVFPLTGSGGPDLGVDAPGVKHETSIALHPDTSDLYVILRNRGMLYKVEAGSGTISTESDWKDHRSGLVRVNRIAFRPTEEQGLYATLYDTNLPAGNGSVIVRWDSGSDSMEDFIIGTSGVDAASGKKNNPEDLQWTLDGTCLYWESPLAGNVWRICRCE